MLVLAIDPGPVQSGFCAYSDAGKIYESGVCENTLLLDDLKDRWSLFDQVAIEMIASYGMAVGKEVFQTCVWIGRFQQAWIQPDDVRLIVRQTVKLHLCGSPRAKDTNVWQALLDRFGSVGTKKAPGKLYGIRSHARAALALAVTAVDTQEGI